MWAYPGRESDLMLKCIALTQKRLAEEDVLEFWKETTALLKASAPSRNREIYLGLVRKLG